MLQLILSAKIRKAGQLPHKYKYFKVSAKLKNRLAIVWEAKKTP